MFKNLCDSASPRELFLIDFFLKVSEILADGLWREADHDPAVGDAYCGADQAELQIPDPIRVAH